MRARSAADPLATGMDTVLRWLFPATDGPMTSFSAHQAVLGRDESCATVLPGAEISRQHAEVRQEGPIAILRDLGSRNGSFVNGLAVKEAPLSLGDVVRLGEWVGVVVEIPRDATLPLAHGSIASGLLGGPKLRAAVAPALQAAKSELPIIIEGETGTGKEVLARAVHERSGRQGSFLAINCAALPEGLAEAELFGYRRGAFTGAERGSLGHFRAAHGGTLLLDEIGDLPLVLQSKILRVLEQREVLPLGESQPVQVDTRVIAATQGSLADAVADNTFRADLFARLEGITVTLPPLRERIEDVPYLFARLLHEASGGQAPGVDPLLVEWLCLYDWPLNVRELVTLVRKLLVIHGHERSLKLGHLPPRLRKDGPRARASSSSSAGVGPLPPSAQSSEDERDERDSARLVEALRRYAGNVSRAAASIGLSRQRAYRLMQARPDLDLDEMRGAGAWTGEGGP